MTTQTSHRRWLRLTALLLALGLTAAACGDSDDESPAETTETTESMGDASGAGEMGEMMMRELADGLALPGGETVSLEPGGYHVMLLDLVDPLEIGETFDVTLDFADADSLTVTVTVAETAP